MFQSTCSPPKVELPPPAEWSATRRYKPLLPTSTECKTLFDVPHSNPPNHPKFLTLGRSVVIMLKVLLVTLTVSPILLLATDVPTKRPRRDVRKRFSEMYLVTYLRRSTRSLLPVTSRQKSVGLFEIIRPKLRLRVVVEKFLATRALTPWNTAGALSPPTPGT